MHITPITLLTLTAFCLLSACASLSPLVASTPALCERTDPSTLHVAGTIDADMAACFEQHVDSALERVVITSTGGSARTAMAIGDRLAPLDVHLVVDEVCASSCANYLVPVAGRLTVRPGAMIALHGSVDRGAVERAGAASSLSLQSGVASLAALQEDYAARHNIPPGWLLYRNHYDGSETGIIGLQGQFSAFDTGRHRAAILIAEEDFLASCLPHLETTPFTDTLVQRAKEDPRLAGRLARDGYFRSGDAQCGAQADVQR